MINVSFRAILVAKIRKRFVMNTPIISFFLIFHYNRTGST